MKDTETRAKPGLCRQIYAMLSVKEKIWSSTVEYYDSEAHMTYLQGMLQL